jgi:DNA invertase Pin-like site-specific DNA recombinase
MKIGYVRVSKQEQNETLQRDALQEAACETSFSAMMTGATFERNGLEKTLAFIRPEDTLVVWKLDRLSRSLKGSHRDAQSPQRARCEFYQPHGKHWHNDTWWQAYFSPDGRIG